MRQVHGEHESGALNQDVLYVAARAPRPGFTKSRLGRAIGHERAAALYAAFVRDLAARLSRAPFRVGWYVTPDDAWDDLAALIPTAAGLGSRAERVLVQPPGDWTARQTHLFATAGLRKERRTVLIASDSPQLGLDLIDEAFARLDRNDLVLGPTEDGGYYLVGMRTPNAADDVCSWAALTGVRMSTGTVLDEILGRAAALGLRASLLPTTFDIDEAADLEQLLPLARVRDDLAATRVALETLGLLSLPLNAGARAQLTPVAVGGIS